MIMSNVHAFITDQLCFHVAFPGVSGSTENIIMAIYQDALVEEKQHPREGGKSEDVFRVFAVVSF